MTVLVTADLHFSDKPRDAYRHEFVDHLVAFIRGHNVKVLLILGDLTEEKDRHSAWLVNTVVEHVRRLASLCAVTILQGNHDALDPTCPFYRFVRWFDGGHCVRWISEPMVTNTKALGPCCFLPHTKNPDDDWAGVRDDFPRMDYIFAHNTFQGTKMPGMPASQGIPTSIFPKGPRVISGDIHAPVRAGPVEYVGAPYLVDFGDEYEPRVLLLRKGKKPESLPCPGRQKRLIELEPKEEIGPALKRRLRGRAGDIVKVRVPVSAVGYKTLWRDMRQQVADACAAAGCHLHQVQPQLPKGVATSDLQESTGSPAAVKSDEEHLVEYANVMGISARVLGAGRDLL